MYAACQWGMLVALAKLGSTEMVGQFTLGLAITAPIVLFTNMQLRNVIATDFRSEYLFRDYCGLRMSSALVAYTVIVLVVIFSGYSREVSAVILAVGFAKIIECLSDVCFGLMQKYEQLHLIAISVIMKGSLSLLLLALTVYVTGSAFWGTVSLATGWLLVLLLFDVPASKKVLKSFNGISSHEEGFSSSALKMDATKMRTLILLALPLGFVEMLASFNINTPRYFVEMMVGINDLGVFSAMAYVIVVGGTAVYAIGQSTTPRLAKYYAENNLLEFKKILFKMLGVSLALGLCGIFISFFAGELLLSLIYTQEYANHNDVFVVLMVAATFNYLATVFWFGIISARYFRVQVGLFGGTLFVNILMCVFLVPSAGMMGAATAFALAELFRALFGAFILWRVTCLTHSNA